MLKTLEQIKNNADLGLKKIIKNTDCTRTVHVQQIYKPSVFLASCALIAMVNLFNSIQQMTTFNQAKLNLRLFFGQ